MCMVIVKCWASKLKILCAIRFGLVLGSHSLPFMKIDQCYDLAAVNNKLLCSLLLLPNSLFQSAFPNQISDGLDHIYVAH